MHKSQFKEIDPYGCFCGPGSRMSCFNTLLSGSDINECLEGDFCFPSGECVNTDGSYKCVCAQGYRSAANGTSCQGMTPDVIHAQPRYFLFLTKRVGKCYGVTGELRFGPCHQGVVLISAM